MAKIDRYLEYIVENHGSDVHLYSNQPAYVRIHGALSPMETVPLKSDDILEMLKEVIPHKNYNELLEEWDTDCAYEIAGLARFRVNGFKDRHGYGTVMRQIPDLIPSFDDLRLPEALRDFCLLTKGLVVITGPTGSGKSTTLASMIDFINDSRNEHIITIEDPIEFVHQSKKCIINQREVHKDTSSFAKALRAALREDPDIILLREIRDLETMEAALECAETGHLVFATLHTNSAVATIDRIIDKFPADKQNQIRTMLADTLQGVVAQTLCKKSSGGRIAVFEVLKTTTSVAALIREAKTHMLGSVLQTNRKIGMQSFNDELTNLAASRIISVKEAYMKAIDKIDIENRLAKMNITLDFKEEEKVLAHERRTSSERQKILESEEALKVNPNDINAMNAIAWILSTSVYDELRNAKKAIKIASQACSKTGNKDPHSLSILGVAHAEDKSFRRAIDATRKAIKLYTIQGDDEIAEELTTRLELFNLKKPFRNE
ncbi:MAG: type IV pilus twitching motility protein PilT [Kiritimatiellae bacterium]|jgi:twitching motility protein PilT|nr:type IV pilus twitching motility protein PilT [Kiritimatiellia bacterium]